MFGSVRFLFERYQASWISQQKVVESASLLKFRGFPIMRTITATTAFKMPLYGVSFPLSAWQESSTVFRNTEKLSCANEVSASKRVLSGAKRQTGTLGEAKGVIKACFQQIEIFSFFHSTRFQKFKVWVHCALKNCIISILQLRDPLTDHRGCFVFKLT